MALQSVEAAPALKEKIPFIVKVAAEWVPVTEFLQLKYQFKRESLSDNEYRQISDGATAIMYDAVNSDSRLYDPGDKIERSADPRVIGTRLILKNVPLAEYLAARQVALQGQLDWNFEKIGFFGGQDLIEKGKRITQELLLTQLVAEAIKTTPVRPEAQRSLVLDIFHAELEKIKLGRIKRYDLATFDRDWEGQEHLYTPAQRIIEGVKLFSDGEIKSGVQSLLNELTGEIDGWGIVDGISSDKPEKRDTSHSHYDVLTWEIPTLVDKVKIGVDKVVDDRGEWARTYYLFHSRA